jgi:predicted RNA-binding Zn-ribbon protein involved in translation (DUF1610 family)
MSETLKPMRVFLVEYVCDKCGEGEMMHGNVSITTNPPLYPHMCTKCGHTENFRSIYPGYRYSEEL